MSAFNNKKNPGITLIEVIISISILAVGIFGILRAFPQGIMAEKRLARETVANQIAQQTLEMYSSYNYDEILVGNLETNVRVSTDPASEFYQYLRTTTVGYIDSTFDTVASDVGLKKITVRVSWPEILGVGYKNIEFYLIKSDN